MQRNHVTISRLPSLTLATAALTLPLFAVPTPAVAQRVNEIIVYGTDPCPRSTDDEVVVCARKPESERFRIPENLRQGGSMPSKRGSDLVHSSGGIVPLVSSRRSLNARLTRCWLQPVNPAGPTGEQLLIPVLP